MLASAPPYNNLSHFSFSPLSNMGVKRVSKGQSFKTITSLINIHILVVDDDSTSLAIVAAMLKTFKYEVFTVKHPVDALSTLRVRPGLFDLVVTDLHMPDMNGFELQKQVEEEFKLPVIMMSADDKESVILKSLAGGAAFYMVKPVKAVDLKNVWQYAIAAKKGKSVVIEEIGSIRGMSSIEKICYEDMISSSSVNEEKCGKKDSKRKAGKKGRAELEELSSITLKKTKVVWTTSLHNRFLEAIKHVGLEKAVPKKILEFMNVPGLTRENVASHLQKYRIFLKKVSQRGASASKKLRSSFASGIMLNNVQEQYPQFGEQQQMLFQPKFGGNIPALSACNLGFVSFPNDQEASSGNSIPQFGYRQSHLLRGQANYQQSMLGNANPLYQAKRSALGIEPHNVGRNLPSHGGSSYDLMNGTNSMQMYQKQTQARVPDLFAAGKSNYNFGISGIRSPNYNPHIEKMGYFERANPTLNVNYTNNNYAGIRMTSDGELVGMRNIVNGGEALADLNGGYGLINGIYNGTLTNSPMGNGTLGSMAQGETSARFENANKFLPMGNGTFGSLAQGEPSSARYESANGPPLFDNVSEQENTVLPRMPQQQYGLGDEGGENNNTFDLMNNVSTSNDIFLPEELDDLSDLFLEQINNYQTPYQQQGGEEPVLNTDFANVSFAKFDTYPPMSELLNHEFSGPYHLEENATWNGQSLGQHQGDEAAILEPNFDNMYRFDSLYPTPDQYPNLQQQGTGEFIDPELYGLYPVDKSLNQGWGEEFMDTFFSTGPYLREE